MANSMSASPTPAVASTSALELASASWSHGSWLEPWTRWREKAPLAPPMPVVRAESLESALCGGGHRGLHLFNGAENGLAGQRDILRPTPGWPFQGWGGRGTWSPFTNALGHRAGAGHGRQI